MFMVVDETGTPVSELLDDRPDDDEVWRIWDTALPLPRGNYPKVAEI
jgi:hypothetical protein